MRLDRSMVTMIDSTHFAHIGHIFPIIEAYGENLLYVFGLLQGIDNVNRCLHDGRGQTFR